MAKQPEEIAGEIIVALVGQLSNNLAGMHLADPKTIVASFDAIRNVAQPK